MIVAVTGGKGGVGKSTVAYNLAAELDGVVVDGDLAMADLPTSHGPDLHDVLAGRASIEETVRTDGPVTIVPCGRTLTGARSAETTELPDALRTLRRTHRWVIVDSPAGLRADVGIPLVAADVAILVTEPSKAAIADGLRVRELARELDTGLCRVVLNRVRTDPATAALADRFGAPVVTIPESEALANAHRHGYPINRTDPESQASDTFEQLAGAIYSCKSR